MLDKSKALKVIKNNSHKGSPRYTYVFKCSYPDCAELIKVRQDALNKASGKCKTHSHVKKPFESIYNSFLRDWRKPVIKLTYKQFLKFTEIKNCHYCGAKIKRQPFPTVKGKYISSAYFLDKKDPKKPYDARNCVVCCTPCNFLKGSRFTYKEFLILGNALASIRLAKERRRTWRSDNTTRDVGELKK